MPSAARRWAPPRGARSTRWKCRPASSPGRTWPRPGPRRAREPAAWRNGLRRARRPSATSDRRTNASDSGRRSGARWTGGVDGERRPGALAVRVTSINHFFFVPVTIGLAFLTALLQTAWYRNKQDGVPAADPVLRHAAGHQRRDRRGDRAGAGVRVRDELGSLLAAGRQHLRRPAGHGGAGRVLPGVHVPRACGCSAGTSCRAGCTWRASGWWRWAACCRRVHHGGELLDAASGRLHDGRRQAAAERHLGGVHQPGVRVGVRARCCWRR